jgi:thioredoxin reductase (NADPH)
MQLNLPSEQPEVYDVIVIGGGPAGATAAIYTARAELSTLVIDKGITAGALGLATRIANYPGVPGEIAGAELVMRMRDQAAAFGAEFVNEKVLQVDANADPKRVWAGQTEYRARTIIVATGTMGRTNTIAGEEELVGRGVSYCATCDAAFFRDQVVAVVGNNDEAADEALTLTRFAEQVHVFSPTPKLQTTSDLESELRDHPKVTLHLASRVREVVGENQVEGIKTGSEGEEQTTPVSGVFIYLAGNRPVTDFLAGQLEKGEAGCLLVDENNQTSVPGIFAAGDVQCGHLRQATVSTAEGVAAAVAVDRYLRGREELRPDWH